MEDAGPSQNQEEASTEESRVVLRESLNDGFASENKMHTGTEKTAAGILDR